MVFKEDLPDLYFAFNDRLEEDGKSQKIIKCKICCLKVPSHSTRSKVCEMCFDIDFWDHQREISQKGEGIMWAVKVVKSGIIGNYYYAKDNYWAGRRNDGVANLALATHYPTKEKAKEIVEIVKKIPKGKELPKLKVVQIKIIEV